MDVAVRKIEGVIVALNSGSSSLKFGVYSASEDAEPLLSGSADGIGRSDGSLKVNDSTGTVAMEKAHTAETQAQALDAIAATIREHATGQIVAVGHRIVHGGPKLRQH